MSLIVPCKYCGKEISLRRMPTGQFVPFDKGTNTPHHCQNQPSSSKSGSKVKPQTHIDVGTSVGDMVFRVVSESPGIKAKQIGSTILRKYGVNVDRSEVNRWLYHDLKGKVYQNGSYKWFPGNAPQRASSAEAPPETKTGPAVNLPSGVKGDSNKLLWAIIVLLIIIVLILLRSR
jgi:hypothetical protein